MNDEIDAILRFPCLFASKNLIRVLNKKEVKLEIKNHIPGGRFLFRNGASPHFTVHFIIDRTGACREVNLIKKYNEWTAPFATWLWDFVTVECEILTGKHLSAGELYQKIQSTCNTKEKHFPNAGRLARFLKKMPPDQIFGEKEFEEFWVKYWKKMEKSDWIESPAGARKSCNESLAGSDE